jgi:hypothetical protein
MLFIGIDGEMSTPNLAEGGRLIQIGVAVRLPDGQIDSQGWLINPGEMTWEARAAAVHGISYETVIQQGRSQDSVDTELHQWLIDRGAHPKRREKNVPVGFNITGFDLPFIKMQLPKTYALLSRRTAELNGMMWLFHGKDGKNFETWKSDSMNRAHAAVDDYKPHDAEWDAKRHLLVFEYLKSLV